jgi:hypothetical protein
MRQYQCGKMLEKTWANVIPTYCRNTGSNYSKILNILWEE